jgi:hypothetical protein
VCVGRRHAVCAGVLHYLALFWCHWRAGSLGEGGGGSGERGAGSARTQTLRREQGLYRVLCDGPERRHSHVVGLSQVSDGGCRTSRRAKLRILLPLEEAQLALHLPKVVVVGGEERI